jgi:hypothetical protein
MIVIVSDGAYSELAKGQVRWVGPRGGGAAAGRSTAGRAADGRAADGTGRS